MVDELQDPVAISLPDAASPLYAKVKDYILGGIAAGTWRSDQRLPSENELAGAMGVSRLTVHRALRELTVAGHLKRVQGVGTFVRAPEPRSGLLEIRSIAAEIEARGERHGSTVVVLETVAATPEVARSFEAEDRFEVFHSIVVHLADGVAVQLEERFVNPRVAPGYGGQDFSRLTTHDYLMRVTPVTELEHLVSAVGADAGTASLLGVPAGAPCLLLRRRTWSGSSVATVNRLTYVGSRHALGSRYRVGEAGQKPAG